jgi:hypothetical protein
MNSVMNTTREDGIRGHVNTKFGLATRYSLLAPFYFLFATSLPTFRAPGPYSRRGGV